MYIYIYKRQPTETIDHHYQSIVYGDEIHRMIVRNLTGMGRLMTIHHCQCGKPNV